MRATTVVLAAAAAIVIALVGFPAQAAWDKGTYLRTGDVVCTAQARSDTGARYFGTVTSGSATASIRVSTTAGGPETVVWSQTGANLSFNKSYYGPPGTHYRGCITITAHTVNTWSTSIIMGLGSSAVGGIGSHTATLSPGARACGDFGLEGPVRLTGTATTSVTWQVDASDQDYAPIGTVFSITGATVDTVYVPDSSSSVLEMCVHNTSQQTITASYELSPAA